MRHCILILATDYGPFAPAVGYIVALGSSLTVFALTWRGRLAKWKPPEEVLPGAAQKMVVLLSIVFVAVGFFYAKPDTLSNIYWISALMAVVAFAAFIIYTVLILTYRYEAVRVKNPRTGGHEFRDILGGFWLTAYARNVMRDGLKTPDGGHVTGPGTIEKLLEGIDGDISLAWSKLSRSLLAGAVVSLFIIVLLLGNVAVGWTGFAIQVNLTGKPAASAVGETSSRH